MRNVTEVSLVAEYKYSLINKLPLYRYGFRIATDSSGGKVMSLRSKVLIFTLAATLAVIAGRSLTTTSLQNVVSTMASAVWGS